MKILLLANDSTYVFNLRREVIEAILRRGWQVVIACTRKQHWEELEVMGCRMRATDVVRHGKNPLQDLKLLRLYSMLMDEEKPDVVLTYNIKPNVYGGIACTQRKIPYLINVCGLGIPLEHAGPLRWLTVMLYRIGSKKAACVFFQNRENERFFKERHMISGHHRILPGSGVNTSRFALLSYPREKTVDFFFISRAMREKGIDQYLEAARVIHKRHPETVFHILGECDDEAYRKILSKTEEGGAIRYHGQQPNVLPFQRINACTVHPTYYAEGMSNVLLESAACARPIITTDRSGCREIVEDGVNGFVCRQKDSDDLIAKIEMFLALPWERRRDMGIAARRKVEREFDRQIIVDAYLEEIEAVRKNYTQ